MSPEYYHNLHYFPAHKTQFFPPEKCDLNSTCVLCAEGKYYFQNYKYLYIYIQHLYREIVETTMKMILVAVTMIFWVSMMSNYIMVANFGM